MPDENLIEQIKERWPDLSFTQENLQRPTPDKVFQFYTSFLMDCEEKILDTIGFYGEAKTDLSPEELVLFKMQKFNVLFKRADIQFLLGDICQPTYIRTKSFFCICNHFLTYFENIFHDFEKISGDITKMREDNDKLNEQKIEISNDITKYVEKKIRLLEDKERLQKNIEATENLHAEYCAQRAEKELVIKEKEKELELLKISVDKTTSQINVLSAREKQCLEEMITEEEYSNLKKLEEQLKSENETLRNDVIHMEDVLTYESKILDHFSRCLKAIPDNFNSDMVNQHISMDIQLKDLKTQKEKLDAELRLLKSTQNNERKKLIDIEGCYLAAYSELNKIIEDIQQEFEELTFTLQKQKEEISNSKREVLSSNLQFKHDIAQYENDIRKLKEHFQNEYVKIKDAENLRFKTIKNHLLDLKKPCTYES
ncbi:protein Spindly-like [Diorhabda sublineata]|uniref:protein Spindly-like n=1 Tax=Diorhabda sublineata TaxID=1163346 RepID=UPI0024E0DCB7|nr:protein Spindly-like [Diorhabda sublineata]